LVAAIELFQVLDASTQRLILEGMWRLMPLRERSRSWLVAKPYAPKDLAGVNTRGIGGAR
jgi:hypothetical protein